MKFGKGQINFQVWIFPSLRFVRIDCKCHIRLKDLVGAFKMFYVSALLAIEIMFGVEGKIEGKYYELKT